MSLTDIAAVVIGLVVPDWSADEFVSGAASRARRLGMDTLPIGTLIFGFGATRTTRGRAASRKSCAIAAGGDGTPRPLTPM